VTGIGLLPWVVVPIRSQFLISREDKFLVHAGSVRLAGEATGAPDWQITIQFTLDAAE